MAHALNPRNYGELTTQYSKFLDEIVDRLWVVMKTTQKHAKGQTINEYPQIDLELCALQIRKSLELVGFLCLLAHRIQQGKYTKKVTKIYNPQEVIRLLKRSNTSYFPVAFDAEILKNDNRFSPVSNTKMGTCMTEEQFLIAYNRFCAGSMHADYSYERVKQNTSSKMLEANSLALKLMSLLGNHYITVNQRYIISGSVNGPEGKPVASVLSRRWPAP